MYLLSVRFPDPDIADPDHQSGYTPECNSVYDKIRCPEFLFPYYNKRKQRHYKRDHQDRSKYICPSFHQRASINTVKTFFCSHPADTSPSEHLCKCQQYLHHGPYRKKGNSICCHHPSHFLFTAKSKMMCHTVTSDHNPTNHIKNYHHSNPKRNSAHCPYGSIDIKHRCCGNQKRSAKM